ncbi:non-ribosomal peptide synthetase [Longimicrobium sp.]|uniref:non-ribosomal peptide synthetase n=1 Tax=Longimicrobium sp. TaxID=2029185 RepID=UPI002B973AED|nr:non-ribosomal peptide synthetase [Longimicrobium sp.]HSU14489.1 amino acid adenylation domain-containing protein [Longimicrobium sp.]
MTATDLSTSCIHPLFETRAAAHPARDALRWRGETLAYAELDARANRLAHHLRALGAGPEVAVGVFLPRTPDLVAALLAVLKAGAAYVPLDPAYPPERVEYMLGDTRVPVLITTAALAERVPHFGGAIVRVDADAAEIAARPAESPAAAVHPENLAYVIYTSGSTGRPKGVQIEHRNTVPVLRWLKETVSDDERASVLASTSVCFDVSIAEIFGTLCWGGTLVLVENALSLAALGEPVTTVAMVPSAAAELLRMGAIPDCTRTFLLGGEPLRNELAQRLYALGHVDRVLNLYGPTEDTTYSTCKEVETGRERAMTVGRPVRGTMARVLDEAMRPVWDGDTGEVWMAGAGVTRGYLGAPAMTAERYRPDPLGGPGARMYRTGDLGRVLPDGDLECLGRMDHQVKVRGFRVEPGEIETALAAHPAVREAVVTAWEDRGEKRLAAYVVPEGAAPGTAELREHLRGRVPEYMVPDAFTFLSDLPHTPNGKVDRLALPAPRPDREGSGEYVAPRTPEEAALARIWCEVLGIDRVGVRDDFFELGGHSLLATQIAARVRQQMQLELPLGTLFAMPTVEELARQLADAAAPVPSSTQIPRAPRDRPLPLSYPQETVWFFQHLKPDMRSYNFQATVRIRGALDAEALRAALEEIVRRHEIFRTVFPAVDGAPAQVVQEPWPVHLPVEDLSHLEVDEQRGEMERRMKEEFRRPFHIDALPLVRWTLFRMDEDEHVLLAIEQHLVHDGWSFGVFLRELTALYPAFARGESPDLAPPAVQFADYAAWQRAWMQTDEAREHLEWWKHRLAGVAPVLEIPADRPRPAEMSFRGSSHRVRLPKELYEAADAFSRRHGVTLFMTLFAAFEALMHRYTGETDFCVGSGVAGRRLRETEDLIGMMVNTIPIRADVSGDPAFEELVERVRTAAVETYQHQDVPFVEIVGAVHPERSRGHLPVFQVAFNFHHAPYPELRLGGAEIEIEEGLGNESAKFDLNIIVIPRAHQHAGSEVVMIWEFAEDLFDAATVRRMIGHFEAVLGSALADPSTRVSRLRMLPVEEERGVLALAGRAAPFPREATLHGLVAGQARERPDAAAIEHGPRTVTYAELETAGDGVAAALRKLGVRAEDRVAVAMERSAELVMGILGALKAGAAYVPLDPEYPAERLAFMLADSGAKALVVRDRVPATLAGWSGPVVSLAALGNRSGKSGMSPDLDSQAAAYVVYTSGSTGKPKGSVISHRAAVRLVRGADYLQPRAGDRMGHAAAPSFDAAAWEIWAPLANGGTLVVIDRDDLLSPQRLGALIRARRVNALFLTTALFSQVAHEAPGTFAPLRDLLTGGEAADPAAFRRVLEACRGTRLVNMYGPSENSTYASWHEVKSVPDAAASVPIGGPVANTTLYVLDASLRPVPSGVPGELYVGGEGLSRGYLGRPGLTAAVFLPNPFAAAPGARMYRTGDRVRWHGGALEFLGRADHQVKIRGFRVEPGEIEAVLQHHPSVGEAVVVAREDVPGERYLAAYVAPTAWRAISVPELREHLGGRLPAWMVPAAFVVMDALPKTPGGKVDRRALPMPDAAAAHDEGTAFAAPETETERAVAEIWREVLGLDRVGATDDFFDLGGHSLKATRILTRVGARLGVELPVGVIFDHPTVRGIAALVDERRAAAAEPDDELLAWLENLSEEEAERLLADRAGGG